MGSLDKIKEAATGFVDHVRGAPETLSGVIGLIRSRTREKIAQAPREDTPRVIKSDPKDFGHGAEVFQVDEETISVAGERLSREALISSTTPQKNTQDDLNSDFRHWHWSCRLGNGENTLLITAYEGREDGYNPGHRILVVKNSRDQIVNVLHPTGPRNRHT